jgi:hypothetical protein
MRCRWTNSAWRGILYYAGIWKELTGAAEKWDSYIFPFQISAYEAKVSPPFAFQALEGLCTIEKFVKCAQKNQPLPVKMPPRGVLKTKNPTGRYSLGLRWVTKKC